MTYLLKSGKDQEGTPKDVKNIDEATTTEAIQRE